MWHQLSRLQEDNTARVQAAEGSQTKFSYQFFVERERIKLNSKIKSETTMMCKNEDNSKIASRWGFIFPMLDLWFCRESSLWCRLQFFHYTETANWPCTTWSKACRRGGNMSSSPCHFLSSGSCKIHWKLCCKTQSCWNLDISKMRLKRESKHEKPTSPITQAWALQLLLSSIWSFDGDLEDDYLLNMFD